jgi:hypothetical protein
VRPKREGGTTGQGAVGGGGTAGGEGAVAGEGAAAGEGPTAGAGVVGVQGVDTEGGAAVGREAGTVGHRWGLARVCPSRGERVGDPVGSLDPPGCGGAAQEAGEAAWGAHLGKPGGGPEARGPLENL